MLGLLGTVGGLFGLNPLTKAAKALGGVLLLISVIGLLWGAKAIYDHGVIERHEARQGEANAKADRKADEHAADRRTDDQSREAEEAAQLERTRTNAKSDADRRVARARCLRLQQAARASGGVLPSCSS